MIAMPTQPMQADIEIEYRRGPVERYDATIHPHDAQHVRVDVRGPAPDEAHGAICRWPDAGSLSSAAVQNLIECFFGSVKALPRIVGDPDWSHVSFNLSAVRGSHLRRLLHIELTAQSGGRAALAMRNGHAATQQEDLIVLCPEDADALYAITRLALLARSPMPSEAAAATAPSQGAARSGQRSSPLAAVH